VREHAPLIVHQEHPRSPHREVGDDSAQTRLQPLVEVARRGERQGNLVQGRQLGDALAELEVGDLQLGLGLLAAVVFCLGDVPLLLEEPVQSRAIRRQPPRPALAPRQDEWQRRDGPVPPRRAGQSPEPGTQEEQPPTKPPPSQRARLGCSTRCQVNSHSQ